MRTWPIFLLAIILNSCGTGQKVSREEISEGLDNRPVWVNDPYEYCGEEYLCAVGEGLSFYRAESEARKSLAKIFKVEVSGTTIVSEESKSISSPGFLESVGITQDVERHTREVVDEVLEGVITSKKHQEDGSTFALAQLDKRIASKLVKGRINAIDEELQQAYDSGRRSLMPKAFDLEGKRSGLISFLTILGIPNFSRGITRSQLLDKKAQFEADPRRVLVIDNGRWEAIAKTASGELITLGYKVVTKKPYHFKVIIDNKARREYLNVKGFERYHVDVKVLSKTPDGNLVGAMAFEKTENGRSLSQIRSSLLTEFREYFVEKLPALELD